METPKNQEKVEKDKEEISAAALMIDGKVYTGKNHAVIISDLQQIDPTFDIGKVAELVDGFVTNTGRFVDRYEAGVIADKADQIADTSHNKEVELKPWGKGDALDSRDLK